MSRRTSIVKALAEKFKQIDGSAPYSENIYNNAYPILKFWDEVEDFPCVYLTPGPEMREYLPSNFAWCYLNVGVKVYVRAENPQEQLEKLLEDCERVIDANRVLVYDTENNYETTEILVTSINTDEGLLAPYGVGEINIQIRYEKES
jgi:hypothetical protein